MAGQLVVTPAGRAAATGRGDAPLAEPGFAHLLHQADHWATWSDAGVLVKVRLDDMGDAHRRRVLAYLREHAEFFRRRELDVLARLHKRGEITVEKWGTESRYLEALDPHVWLDDTALVRRLVQLTPAQPVAPRRRRLLPRRFW